MTGPLARRLTSPNWRAWVMSAQLPGLVGLQNNIRPSASVSTMVSTAFCLLLPEMKLVPVLASGGRPPDPDLGAVDDPGLPAGTEMVDDLAQRPQPQASADGASSLGEQLSHLADSPGDGGAVDVEPAGQHVVRGFVCARSVSDRVAVRSAGVETRSLVSSLQLAGSTTA